MLFAELHSTLLDSLRARVRNGELTERQLARLVGISQPHVHNVLKGARDLSTDMADEILIRLNISVLDLVPRAQIEEYLRRATPHSAAYTYIPVISGSIGPKHAWCADAAAAEKFAIPADTVALMTNPVVGRLDEDEQMHGTFAAGDLAIFDQNVAIRREPEPSGLYLVKVKGCGLIRRVRVASDTLFLLSDSAVSDEEARVPLNGLAVEYIVRGKATLISGKLLPSAA